jgi:hypothetical protein
MNSVGHLINNILVFRFGLTVPSHGAFWLAQNKSKPKVQTESPNRNTKGQAGTASPNRNSKIKKWIWSYGLDLRFRFRAMSIHVST